MKLGKFFSLTEMTQSQTAVRKGIDNMPNEKELECLKELVKNVLDPIREHFEKPVTINSGFRGAKLNRAVGGSSRSQHCKGQAADIEIAAREIMRMREKIRNIIALHTGQTVEKIAHDTDRDFYLDPQQAVEYGIVDEILSRQEKK